MRARLEQAQAGTLDSSRLDVLCAEVDVMAGLLDAGA
jgi:hypothetical protein